MRESECHDVGTRVPYGDEVIAQTPRLPTHSPAASALVRSLAGAVEGARVLVLTADQGAREALAAELDEAGVPRGSFALRTMTGFASAVLEATGERFRSGKLLGDFATRALFDTALDATPTPAYPRNARASSRFRDDLARVARDLAHAEPAARERLATLATPRVRDCAAVAAAYRGLLERAGAFDRASLLARATDVLARGDGAALRFAREACARVTFCAIEDFDAAGVRFASELALLGEARALHEPAAGLSDVGDRDIGRAALARLCERAATETLHVQPRAASAIVETIKARAPAEEAAAIAERIERALASGISPSRIGLVLREVEPYGALLVRELRARAIPCASPGEDELRDDPSIAFVRATLALFDRPGEAARWAHALGSPLVGNDPLRIRLALAGRALGHFAQTLDELGDDARTRAALVAADEAWREDDLARCARTLVREFAFGRAVAATNERAAAAAIARVRAFVDVLASSQRALRDVGADASCAAVVRRVETRFDALAREIAGEPLGDGVRVLDIRASKRAALDLVFIPNAVEGRFPREARSSPLFGPDDRAALARAGLDLAAAREGDDPRERRLWYVAAERGRTTAIASYAVTDSEGRPTRPSRAIPLAALPPSDAPPYARAYRPAQAAALGGTPALERLATLLDARASTDPGRGPARGVRREAPLAVGAVDRWLQCPRRFYFERIAGIGGEQNAAMRFGSALHLVLERFHRNVVDFRAVAHDDVARWTAQLHALQDEIANPIEADHPPLDAYARGVLRRMLAEYARSLEAEARARPFVVEACERDVEIALGRARLRGRIDRLDRTPDGALTIRDYKSGTKHAKLGKGLAEVASSIAAGARLEGTAPKYFSAQLALYRLALPEVSRLHAIYFGGEAPVRDAIAEDELEIDAAREMEIAALADYVRAHLAEPLLDGTPTVFRTTSDETLCRACDHRRICTGPGSIP